MNPRQRIVGALDWLAPRVSSKIAAIRDGMCRPRPKGHSWVVSSTKMTVTHLTKNYKVSSRTDSELPVRVTIITRWVCMSTV